MSRISPRIAAVAESATLAIDAKAKALKAAGEPVIGFGAGEPDFPTPKHVVDAAIEACSVVANHRYSPTSGLPDLRNAIAAKTKRDTGLEVDPANVLVTNGGKQAVYESFLTILGEGDECIIPAPYWTTYPECVGLAGATVVEIATDETNDFKVTVEQLEAARTPRTKALVFCSPSNPTGSVYTRAEMIAVGQWAVANNVWVITDEIYEHLVYGDAETLSMPVLVPELADTCIVLNGVAKTFAMTGWRIGWMIGPSDVIKAATNLQSHATSNVNNVAQRAALAAVSGSLDCVAEMRVAYDRRRKLIHEMLNEIPGVVCPEPKGAFYAFPSFKGVLGREIGGVTVNSTLELAAALLDQVKVAVVPGEAFGAPGYLRFSYALADDDLVEGITRLQKLLA